MILLVSYLPVSSSKEVSLDFLDSSGSNTAFIFFGFRGCTDVCPLTLAKLSQFVSQPSGSSRPQVLFIDIDRNNHPKDADEYAKQFHTSFRGIKPSTPEINELASLFGIPVREQGFVLAHAGKTYFLRKDQSGQWSWVKTYPAGAFDPRDLLEELY
ncbi:SCO family protein [Veronia pacifica]|uniref:Thioredoxin domain-containing protein n=1 Tax=Veronia pacifica TaxID=1080227 RepID=A0A1C3EF17_9GAMM|nr:SCO family protein [Veronia pacifica]ODA31835.1 hypothetical protein A8L45_15195 [Veronia pacifica]